jgi:hypothetical protein
MRKVAWSVFTSASSCPLYSRNLFCSRFSAARERQICEALQQREMEWIWTGHAMVAPSFRVTFDTVKKVCALSVAAHDTPSLVSMVVQTERKRDGAMADMQLQNGRRFLFMRSANKP